MDSSENKLNRRRFLQKSALVAAGSAALNSTAPGSRSPGGSRPEDAITAMILEPCAGSSTKGWIRPKSRAALPAAANTTAPWAVTKLATRLKALNNAAPPA